MKTQLATLIAALLFLGSCDSPTGEANSTPPTPATNTAASTSAGQLISQATLVKIAFNSGEKFAYVDTDNLLRASKIISTKESPAFKCGYDGSISYVKGDEALLSAEFNLKEDCRHIAFMEGENLLTRSLTPEGYEFLNNLRETGQPTEASLKEMSWMLGKWGQSEAPGVISFEEWKMISEVKFVGNAFTLQNEDTAFSEKLELVQEADGIYYIPTISEEQGPVRFKLTTHGPRNAVFENLTHDFPQTIAYKSTEDTILHARISGISVDESGKEKYSFKDFFMQKVK
jgi:hypothetical protein